MPLRFFLRIGRVTGFDQDLSHPAQQLPPEVLSHEVVSLANKWGRTGHLLVNI